MHEAVGKCTVVGEQQQSAGVYVETADADPAPLVKTRQTLVNRFAALGIGARAHDSDRLVVHQYFGARRVTLHAHQLAIDGDFFATVNLVTGFRHLAVNADATFLQ